MAMMTMHTLTDRTARAAVAAFHAAMQVPGRYVFLADVHTTARAGFHAARVAAEGMEIVKCVRAVNGAECIEFLHGGSMYFIAASSKGYRGIAADVLFVMEHLMHSDQATDILPMVATGNRIVTF